MNNTTNATTSASVTRAEITRKAICDGAVPRSWDTFAGDPPPRYTNAEKVS